MVRQRRILAGPVSFHAIYSGQELRERLEQAGFNDVKLFGTLSGGEYDVNAQRLIAVGRKPGGGETEMSDRSSIRGKGEVPGKQPQPVGLNRNFGEGIRRQTAHEWMRASSEDATSQPTRLMHGNGN